MDKSFVFDQPQQAEFMQRRREFLGQHLPQWKQELGLRTALDVGCGVGHFSAFLRDAGFTVTGVDGREENIAEARSRHTGIDFRVADAEDPHLSALGEFDLVLAFGLLYHLENPFRAVRNLRGLTGKLLLVESLFVPGEVPMLLLLDEYAVHDQSLGGVSCYPTEGAIIKMAYRSGFPHAYRFRKYPDHEQFRRVGERDRVRTLIAASNPEMHSPVLEAATEPSARPDRLTEKERAGFSKLFRRLGRGFRRPAPPAPSDRR
ncbi:MAG: methyltransferase domain-containing protein [Candidatus Acidiferrales bacterium]